MKTVIASLCLCGVLLASVSARAAGAEPLAPGVELDLRRGWVIQSSAKVAQPGNLISTATFKPAGWYSTEIPSTVLAALVRNKVYPDPDYGMNLRSIPGTTYPIGGNFANLPMPKGSPFRVGWWFRTQFRLPANAHGKNLWLHFDGINNSANIWLNGHQIASADQVSGMRRRYEFNVTGSALPGEQNTVAVEVFPPTPNDLAITFVDWNPLPPDKDMGLYRDVYVTESGPVAVRNAQVITRFDLPSLNVAHLTVSADLVNAGSDAVRGVLKTTIGDVALSQPVRLAPHETRRVVFTPQTYSQLNFQHPRLWWPWEYGAQNFYHLRMEFATGGSISDREDLRFAVRQITSGLDSQNHRFFMVNGKRILIRGAGWSPDMLLRLSEQREEDEIRYVRGMNLNAIRLEGKLMDDHFFDLCDRYGVLVIAGWCCCSRWEHWKAWTPKTYAVAEASLRSQVRRLRNHPCILAFFYGSDKAPPPQAESMYLKVFREEHWPNPTVASAGSYKTEGAGWTGVKMTGPYNYVAPSYWTLDHSHGGAFGFNTETSPGPAIPVLASLKEFLPQEHLWPIDHVWDYHAGGGEFKNLDIYNAALGNRYGKARNLNDYVEKSQLMAYEGERAMFEAFGGNKYTSTGVIQWMLNNAWPSTIWHLFDYYLRPGGGYFGAQKACEPLHIQYAYADHSVEVVNSTLRSFSDYRVSVEVLNIGLQKKFSKSATVSISPDSAARVLVIPQLKHLTKTYFVRLTLADAAGRIVSRNFYWLSTHPDVFNWDGSTWYYTPLESYADFTGLRKLPRVALELSLNPRVSQGEAADVVTVKNPTSHLAFFVRLRVLKGPGGEAVHPILWQDNYFELMPGETRTITAKFRSSELGGAQPVAAVDGWNVKPVTVQ